jgi:tetratricopeptide (TPR) repeat protein
MFPRSHSIEEHNAALYGIALAVSLFLAVRYRRRAPLACYGYLVFILLLVPTSSVIPIQDAMAERRMYLPIFGLALVAASLLNQSGLADANLRWPVAGIVLVCALLSWDRSKVWSSPLALWRDVTVESPNNLRARINLAAALLEQGYCSEAAAAYQEAARLQPKLDNIKAESGLAAALECAGAPGKARIVLRHIAQREPSSRVLSELGRLAAKEGDQEEAAADLDEAVRLDPGYAPAWALRGLVDESRHTGNPAEDFRKALALDPGNEVAKNALSQLQGK